MLSDTYRQSAGVTPAATLMIGDTAFDMQMARNAKVGAVGVAWGYHAKDRLTSAGAHVIVENGADLLAAIDRQLAWQVAGR